MNNYFTTKLTLDDYLSANRLNFRGVAMSRKPLYIIGIIGVVYTGLMLTLETELSLASLFRSAIYAFGIALAFVLLIYALTYALLPYHTKKMLAQNKLAGLETTIEIIENGIRLSSEAGITNLSYDFLFKWAANEKVIALYSANNIFFILPRRSMSAIQYDDILIGLKKFDARLDSSLETKS